MIYLLLQLLVHCHVTGNKWLTYINILIKKGAPSIGKKKDPLFLVVLMCKESEDGKPQGAFVQMVAGAPEPMTVLTFNWPLDDVERFCTKQQKCTVLSIDLTFNLSDFCDCHNISSHPVEEFQWQSSCDDGAYFCASAKCLKLIVSLHHH